MGTGLISVGVGVISYSGTVAFSLYLGPARGKGASMDEIIAISALSALFSSSIGLAAARGCKDEGKDLTKKDVILIGGAGFAGGVAGIATVVAVAVISVIILIGACIMRIMGGCFAVPLYLASSLAHTRKLIP